MSRETGSSLASPRREGPPLQQRIAVNKRRVITLALQFGALVWVVFALIFLVLGGSWFGLLLALVIAGIWTGIAWLRADAVVLDLCDVVDADPEDHARLFNVVAGLCAAMGLSAPDLYVIEDPALNALAVGRDDRHASIVVTTGLLEHTSLVELEAVIALEMYRIKSGDIGPETLVVPTFGVTAVLSEAFDNIEFLRRFFALPMRLVDNKLVRLHSARSELDTDIAAVEFTRYPPALAQGLERMVGKSALTVATPVTSHLWAAPPMAPSAHPAITRLHAPLSERISVLQEL